MGIQQKILVRGQNLRIAMAYVLCLTAMLTACGQKGNLYMPNDPEFKQRATLPDIVRRQLPGNAGTPAATPPANTPHTAASAVTAPASAASAAGR